jgi:hypothetical protein
MHDSLDGRWGIRVDIYDLMSFAGKPTHGTLRAEVHRSTAILFYHFFQVFNLGAKFYLCNRWGAVHGYLLPSQR